MVDNCTSTKGARHGPFQAQVDYHQARQSYMKAIKRGFKSVHDRLLNNEVHRASHVKGSWTEETWLEDG